jgi:2,3-bisphosphoglycerate-dependent phosphoglycerate mutase
VDSTIDTIALIRHARSIANDDPTVYLRMPDHTIPLAMPEDDPAAVLAGTMLASLALDPAAVCTWCSTYLRSQQTQTIALDRAFGGAADAVHRRESFLLREQDFGDWDGLTDDQCMERDQARWEKRRRLTDSLGRFYFRYPAGESRADVVQRMAIFIAKIHRSRYRHHLVFLHGVTQRAFRMSWFNHPVEWFEAEPNPSNASVLVIRRDVESGRWVDSYLAP